MAERSTLDLWFTGATTVGALSMPVLALLGVMPWGAALALFVVIGCGGEVIRESVTRARTHTLDAKFVAAVAVGVVAGLALAVWVP